MFAKGQLAENKNLTLYFDSGLIALTTIDGKLFQASFTASRDSLVKWGFDIGESTDSCFFPTCYSLSVDRLSQANTLIWYDKNLQKDRNFGGIRIDGLISHGWLKQYSWTIDFDKMQYYWGA